VLKYIEAHGLKPGGSPATPSAAKPAPAPTAEAKPSTPKATPSTSALKKHDQKTATVASQTEEFNTQLEGASREEKVVPMSMIRRTIANRLVEAQQTAALLTTFNEIDMKPVMDLRRKYKEPFLKKHGVKLGFMSFFAKAVVESLKRFPAINAEVQGTNVVWKNYFDIGIAIGGGKGLVVPVLRDVQRLSFADIEQQIGQFASLAQSNKLTPADLTGGTFTISNGGVYGSLLSTPIVNPPQSGILGLHTIQDRPIALNGEVVIRPMMYVALTYDHRIVDGREAVGFLKTIKEVLEEPARLFLEV
jgi:2-oxoglutarate dehydrogenase E2 component (dihydrolipoamide succinyltransferase)